MANQTRKTFVTINYLTADEKYVFSSCVVSDEATAKTKCAEALSQGIPCYYLVPTKRGDKEWPAYRRVNVGLSASP
ncbi:MAG: hypothetical protein OXL36_14945 [Bryobacterales bacterium]|nr:hypothetical protein [Bryobacterales bacterium]MDE0295854.1 hypothetical protein [Bryobacterales bacterium]